MRVKKRLNYMKTLNYLIKKRIKSLLARLRARKKERRKILSISMIDHFAGSFLSMSVFGLAYLIQNEIKKYRW